MAHHLDETRGLQLQEDVGEDVGPAQHTLQAESLQEPVQLGQQVKHVSDKPATREWKRFVESLKAATCSRTIAADEELTDP